MKPDFALFLSFDGIALLQRAASMGGPSDGWYRLGEVALTVPDLGAALADLRAKAIKTGEDGPEVKLVLPEEQVKFMTIPAPADAADLDETLKSALDGATPYPVEDLAFDYALFGNTLHIAAVTHETLAEAETFAREHDFLPLAYVTIPPKGDLFPREPFFGTTKTALTDLTPGVSVTGDDLPIAILGDAPEPGDDAPTEVLEQPEEDAKPATAPDEQMAEPDEAAAPEPEDSPSPQSKASDATKAPAPETVSTTDGPDPEAPTGAVEDLAPEGRSGNGADAKKGAPAKATPAKGEQSAAQPSKPLPSPADVPPAVKPVPGADDAQAPMPTPGFSSIRAQRDTATPDAARTPLNVDKGSAAASPPPMPKPQRDVSLTAQDALAQRAKASLTERPKAVPDAAQDADETASDSPGGGQRAASFATAAMARASTGLGKGIGFVSRRTSRKSFDDDAPPAAAKEAATTTTRKPRFSLRGKGAAAAIASGNMMDESERMTVFGARGKQKVGGKPRFLGLILTSILLLFLLAVAAWASLFLDGGVASLFGRKEATAVASVAPDIRESEIETPSETPIIGEDIPEPALRLPVPEEETAVPEVNLASLSEGVPALSEELIEDQVDGLSVPFEAEALTPEQAEARYAATGIWQRAPAPPAEPDQGVLADLYVASIDPGVNQGDAIAIPALRETLTDRPMSEQRNPLPFDSGLKFDDDGLVEPTPEGVVTPDGYTLILGSPAVKPPARPAETLGNAADAADAKDGTDAAPAVVDEALAAFRPRPRPENLVEQNERANLGGISLSEFAKKRPRLRPEVSEEITAGEADETATQFAVAASIKPNRRPRNFSSLVDNARKQAERTEVVQTAAVAPRTVQPRIPSSANVAKQATVRNAINLRKVNLIGVYGKPSARRALVRLSNGRYKKVKVGDRIDGGRVAAIGEDRLSYTKSGRQVVLRMPKG